MAHRRARSLSTEASIPTTMRYVGSMACSSFTLEQPTRSGRDDQAVLDVGDAGAAPRGVLGLATLGPRGDRARQRDDRAGRVDVDVVGIDLRVAHQRRGDLRLGDGWR